MLGDWNFVRNEKDSMKGKPEYGELPEENEHAKKKSGIIYFEEWEVSKSESENER